MPSHGEMLPVRVTVAVGRKIVDLDDLQDAKVTAALRQAARDIGVRLATVRCPTHGRGPINVTLHFDASGTGDVKYESCCERLGEQVAKLI